MLLGILFEQPLLFIAALLAIIIALTVHEYAHAAMARALGDPTAERMGRLSLNPLVHLDPVGFLMLLVAGFGYARPVPFDPRYLAHPRRDSVLVGFAGPISNIIMAVLFALALKLTWSSLGADNLLVNFLYLAAMLNVNLALFNLIPIPPLDGSHALFAALRGPQWNRLRQILAVQGPMILLLLIILDSVGGIGIFSAIFGTVNAYFFALFGIS
jgi:Zn-dependent protease